MLRVFAFSLLIYSGCSWVLETTHEQVTVGLTKNVTLKCRYDNYDNESPRITDVLGIVIHKFQVNLPWETYAKIRIGDHNAALGENVGSDVSVEGHADKVHNSFLSMTWSTSSLTTIGRYACEINGYAEDDSPVQVVTEPISIREYELSLKFLLSMFLDMKKQNEGLAKKIHEEFDTLRNDVSSEIGSVRQELYNETWKQHDNTTNDNIIKIVGSRIRENWYEKRKWPGGQYAMLNTDTGCPESTTSVWKAGYIKFRSESNQIDYYRRNAVSQPSHLAQPTFETNLTNNYVNIRTCKRATNSSGPAWPKGSYCIHRVGGFCPAGFEQTSFQLDSEDVPRLTIKVVDPPDVRSMTSTRVVVFYFCCRQDENSTIPIILPMDKPFYLYRFKGTCQSVHGAEVSQEWLRIDTEHSNNGDKYLTRNFPDSSLNPFHIFLCYYTKSP